MAGPGTTRAPYRLAARVPAPALIAAAFLIVAAVVAAALALGGGDSEQATDAPREVSVGDLRERASDADSPIYWAGTGSGTRFELTETSDGRVYVRYLPAGVRPGDERPDFLTVGTYPYPRAYAAVEEASGGEGMARAEAPAGGLAVWNAEKPRSVYVGYPGSDFLVEVFSPDAAEARQLVLDGEVGPVDPNAPTQAPADLAPLPELNP